MHVSVSAWYVHADALAHALAHAAELLAVNFVSAGLSGWSAGFSSEIPASRKSPTTSTCRAQKTSDQGGLRFVCGGSTILCGRQPTFAGTHVGAGSANIKDVGAERGLIPLQDVISPDGAVADIDHLHRDARQGPCSRSLGRSRRCRNYVHT